MKEQLTPQMLALYLGCECAYYNEGFAYPYKSGRLTVIADKGDWGICYEYWQGKNIIWSCDNPQFLKPILRPLADMTEEECGMIYMLATDEVDFKTDDVWNVWDYKEGKMLASKGIRNSKRDWWEVNIDTKFNVLKYEDDGEPVISMRHQNQHLITTYLLSKHFDLFGWIENGLAIDATKIKKP